MTDARARAFEPFEVGTPWGGAWDTTWFRMRATVPGEWQGSEVVARLSHRLVAMAHKAGAECIAVACPLCHVNLDLRQADGAKAHGPLPAMPVLYITQLLGLALGLSADQLGLNALTVSAAPVVARCAVAAAAPSVSR